MLILETEPKFKDHFEKKSDPLYKYLFGLNSAIMVNQLFTYHTPHVPAVCGGTRGVCSYITLDAHPNTPSPQLYFTADYLLRLFTHPQYKDFLKMFLPWLDILSILPFYVEVIMMIVRSKQMVQSQGKHPQPRPPCQCVCEE